MESGRFGFLGRSRGGAAALGDARDRLATLLTKYPNTNFGNDVGAKLSVIDREIAGGPCEP